MPIIVYDMGMNAMMREKVHLLISTSNFVMLIFVHVFKLLQTKNKCRCDLRIFDSDRIYSSISPHVADFNTFSWKPLIIRVS